MLNKKIILTIAFMFLCISMVMAQINLNSNVINFRDNTNKGQATTHYGKLSIYGNAQSNQNVLYVKYDSTGTASNIYAVKGECAPSPAYGVGGYLIGGAYGLFSTAIVSGSGDRYGSYCWAANGSGSNCGTYGKGQASGSYSSFGVYGMGNSTGVNYGVYGTASGGTTNYGVYCSGNGAYTGTWSKVSDENLKKDIQPIQNILEKIKLLQPVSYNYDLAKYPDMGLNKKTEFGITAQNLESVFPEMVSNNVFPGSTDSTKTTTSVTYKGVDYIQLVPVLLEAIQEQQKRIEALETALKIK